MKNAGRLLAARPAFLFLHVVAVCIVRDVCCCESFVEMTPKAGFCKEHDFRQKSSKESCVHFFQIRDSE